MFGNDAFTRPSMSLVNQVETIHHDSGNNLSYRDAESYVAPNEENYTNPLNDENSQFMEREGERLSVKRVTREPPTSYVDVKGPRPSSIRKTGKEDSDGENRRSYSLSSDVKADTDSGYESTDPIVAARSHDELLISASKPFWEGPGNVSKITPRVNPSDASTVSFAYAPQNMPYAYTHDASTSSSRRHVPSHHGSYNVDSSGYPSSVHFKYASQGSADIYRSSHLSDCRTFGSDVGTTGGSCGSGRAGPMGSGSVTPYAYETTPHITQFGKDYDSFPPNDVSFAAFERRDIESEISLPIANIGRVMKSVLPGSAKIAKQAKDIVRDCITEFIMFVSSEASDICASERRKTMNGEDIILAMNSLGFERYNDALRSYHARWRERNQPSVTNN